MMNSPNISSFRHTTIEKSTSNGIVSAENAEPAATTSDSSMDPLHELHIGKEQRSEGYERNPRRRHPTLWAGAAVLGIAIMAAATWLGLRPKTMAPPVVAHAPPTSRGFGGLLTAGGYVRHARVVNVVPRVSGIIATLRVSEGDVVREGDIIATLDRDELGQQVAESRAELRVTQARLAELKAGGRREEIASARAKVDAFRLTAERLERDNKRTQALAETGAVSAQVGEGAQTDSLIASKTLDSAEKGLELLEAGPRPESIAAAQAAVEAAQARLARAANQLRRTEIRAPLSGRVLRKFVDVGATVSFGLPYTEGYNTLGPGSPIVSIGQLEGLEATADINQTDLGRLSLGEKVEVSADAFPGKTYLAHVARFSPRADRNKNTVEITVRFDDPVPGELIHDLSVKLSFVGGDPSPTKRNVSHADERDNEQRRKP